MTANSGKHRSFVLCSVKRSIAAPTKRDIWDCCYSRGYFRYDVEKGKAFCERALASYRQQHGKDKQNFDFAAPRKISADAHAASLGLKQAWHSHTIVSLAKSA